MSVSGPLIFGYWKLWQLLFTYAPIGQLGISSGANRNIPFHMGRNDDAAVRRTLETTLCAGVWNALLAGILGYVIALLSVGATDALRDRFIAPSLAAAALSWSFYGTMLGVGRSLNNFKSLIIAQFLVSATLIASIPLILKFEITGFLIGTAASSAVGALVIVIPIRNRFSLRWHGTVARELVGLGLPLLIVGLTYTLLTTLDRVIIAMLAGPDFVGLYALAILTFGTLALIPSTLSQYFYPSISFELGQSGSPRGAMAIARMQIRIALIATGIISLCVGLLLPFAVPRFLPEYSAGIGPAFALIPGLLGLAAIGGYANWLNAMKKQFVYLRVQLIAVGVSAVTSVSLYLLGLGIVGVALGSSLSLIIYAAHLRRAALRNLPDTEE